LVAVIEIAFPEVVRNLIKRALFPLFRLRQPKGSARRVQRSTLPADRFLTAYFREPVHEPHSCDVRSTDAVETLAEQRPVSLTLLCKTARHDATAKCANCIAAILRNPWLGQSVERDAKFRTPVRPAGSRAVRHISLMMVS
jgi:hypothetical protein